MVADLLSYAWLKARGQVCWWLVKPFPLPMGLSRHHPLYRLSARLWGIAYYAGEVRSFEDWQDYWRPMRVEAARIRAFGEG